MSEQTQGHVHKQAGASTEMDAMGDMSQSLCERISKSNTRWFDTIRIFCVLAFPVWTCTSISWCTLGKALNWDDKHKLSPQYCTIYNGAPTPS